MDCSRCCNTTSRHHKRRRTLARCIHQSIAIERRRWRSSSNTISQASRRSGSWERWTAVAVFSSREYIRLPAQIETNRPRHRQSPFPECCFKCWPRGWDVRSRIGRHQLSAFGIVEFPAFSGPFVPSSAGFKFKLCPPHSLFVLDRPKTHLNTAILAPNESAPEKLHSGSSLDGPPT